MRRLLTCVLLLGLGIALTDGALAQGNRLYKWVDENGNVHYSDRLESSAVQHHPRAINSYGMEIAGAEENRRPLTPEERRRQQEERRNQQLDTMLLANYSNELELLRAHDETRAAIESSLRAMEENVARLRRDLAQRELRSGAPPDDPVVNRLKQQLQQGEADLERMRTRRFELYEQQNREVARFRELTMRDQS